MSPKAGEMLMNSIIPIITAVIARGAVKSVGAEDQEELTADTVATAARMLHNVEASGRPFTASTVAYYALLQAKTGRRSTSGSRTDVLSPGCQLEGRCDVVSMDAQLGDPVDGEEPMSFHDVIADRREDPAVAAARHMAWDGLLDRTGERERELLRMTAEGHSMSDIADHLGVSRPRITQMKREIAGTVVDCFGDQVLAEIEKDPEWRRGLRVVSERRACRFARAA